MPFEFREARRAGVGLLVGLAGGTGSGKTYSALRLAKGIAGEQRFAVIDTEAGRAQHYADAFQFDHGDLTAPFSAERYLEAIVAAEAAGYPVVVVDSASHEHAGEGGLLDQHEAELDRMAGEDWKKREACSMAAWVRPKQAHKRFVNRLLQLRCHVILCFRAEPKVEMVKDGGRWVIVEKKSLVGHGGWIPVSEKNLPYELTVSFLLMADRPGVPIPIKLQEQHKPFFPEGQPIAEEAGAQLAKWAAGAPVDWPALIAAAKTVAALEAVGQRLKTATLPKSAKAVVRDAYADRLAQLTKRQRRSPSRDDDVSAERRLLP